MAAEILHLDRIAPFVALVPIGALWLFWSLSAAYLLFLLLGATVHRRRERPIPSRMRRICLLIPAHNEEMLLGDVLDRLHQLDYPIELYRLVVIADNCTDQTARVARDHGAEVMERTDTARRGKGFALQWALDQLLPDPRRFDAFLILDADSVLSTNFLRIMNAALEQGHAVVQGRYDVLNVEEGWRTRLMTCALALAHYVRPLGRNTWRLSDGLKGNGMCFSRLVLEQVPWSGESITEDIEYTIRLVLAGIRIEFAPEAVVYAQMPTTGREATTQRQRWEGGRYRLFLRAVGLLGTGLRRRSPMVIDRAVELIIPPFAELFALPVGFLFGLVVWRGFSSETHFATQMMWAWGSILLMELCYLIGGLAIARVPFSVASSLLLAPFYILWKFGLYLTMLVHGGPSGWHRTERHRVKGSVNVGEEPPAH